MTNPQVEVVWSADFWDGPVAGLARSGGETGWFRALWDDAGDRWTDNPRQFTFHRLTSDELRAAQVCHQDFERWVGTNMCGHVPRRERQVRPAHTHELFYERYPARSLDPEGGPALFSFTDRDLQPLEQGDAPSTSASD